MRKSEEILYQLLAARGIASPEDVTEFLSDRPQKTYDPFLLHNMEAGVDLLLSEIKAGTKICIYGDYDADGVTSICILSHVLGMLTDNWTYYIPSRFEEGYGLNKDAIARICDDGAGLLITVDCGSVSYDEVEFAKELGMRVIVTDHHRIEDVRADCILINPKQKECQYPFRELAGCGVAFKLCQALQKRTGLPKSVLNDVLDMAAVGTVGDIVSLTDENRTIVKYGLDRINRGSRKALKRLTDAISLHDITSENIAFGIAPHINAAGRMASASEAVELFLADETGKMDRQIDKLISFNSQRKKKQDDAYNRCMEKISGRENFILLNMEDIHEGIAGIAAGKLKESAGRPVIIVTPSGEGHLKGTGRSIEPVDIFEVLKKHEELFVRFGGHRSACGFLMPEENFDQLKAAVEHEMELLLADDPELFEKKVEWDLHAEPDEISLDLARCLQKMEPFGQGNPRPVLMMQDVVLQNIRYMGSEKTHVRFTAVSGSGGRADCVLFQRAQELKDIIEGGHPVRLTGTVGIQSWRGRESVQFTVEEIDI